MCDHFDPYPSLLKDKLVIEGEVAAVTEDRKNLQTIVGEYLSSLSLDGVTYDTTIQGRPINDTEASEPMDFLQSAESCSADCYWEAGLQMCRPCPGAKNVRFSDEQVSLSLDSVSNHHRMASGSNSSFTTRGRNILTNRELVNVTIAPKFAPSWLKFNIGASSRRRRRRHR
mmetsp:Transcript_24475/g.45245  ORF Transcript_24475/g.45245 Transcript_24475/m.45245 type:complete len:171 (+) Transcript_24475:40-552(+)